MYQLYRQVLKVVKYIRYIDYMHSQLCQVLKVSLFNDVCTVVLKSPVDQQYIL